MKRILIAWMVCGAAAAALPAIAPQAQTASEATHRARLEKAYADGKAAPAPSLLLAKLWIVDGQSAQALQLLTGLSAPRRAEDWTRRILIGLALEGLQRYHDARKAYEDLVASEPQDAAALLRLASVEYRIGDAERARAAIDRAARSGSWSSPEGLYLRFMLERWDRDAALARLIAADGPDGYWSRQALPPVAGMLR